MGNIYNGLNSVTDIQLVNEQVKIVYAGSKKVWEHLAESNFRATRVVVGGSTTTFKAQWDGGSGATSRSLIVSTGVDGSGTVLYTWSDTNTNTAGSRTIVLDRPTGGEDDQPVYFKFTISNVGASKSFYDQNINPGTTVSDTGYNISAGAHLPKHVFGNALYSAQSIQGMSIGSHTLIFMYQGVDGVVAQLDTKYTTGNPLMRINVVSSSRIDCYESISTGSYSRQQNLSETMVPGDIVTVKIDHTRSHSNDVRTNVYISSIRSGSLYSTPDGGDSRQSNPQDSADGIGAKLTIPATADIATSNFRLMRFSISHTNFMAQTEMSILLKCDELSGNIAYNPVGADLAIDKNGMSDNQFFVYNGS